MSLWQMSHVISPCPLTPIRNSFQWPFLAAFPLCAGCQTLLKSNPHFFNKLLAAISSFFCLFLSLRFPNTSSTATTKESLWVASAAATPAASWTVSASGSSSEGSAATTCLAGGSCGRSSCFDCLGGRLLESERRGRLITFTGPLWRRSLWSVWLVKTGGSPGGSCFALFPSALRSPRGSCFAPSPSALRSPSSSPV